MPPLTEEELKDLESKLGASAANMVTARLSTLEKKLTEKVMSGVGELLTKTLDEKLAGFRPAADPNEPAGNKGKKDVEIETLRNKLEEERQARLTQEARANEQTAKIRRKELHGAVVDELSKQAKIDGMPARLALASLAATGRIGYDEDGENPDRIIFKGDDGLSVDLTQGLKQWLKTDEGKFFLPAVTTRGSGSRPSSGAGGGAGPNGQLTNDQRMEKLNQLLDDNL